MLWLEHDVCGVIQTPIPVQQPAFRFHLTKERSTRVRRQDMEGRAFETVLFNPFGGGGKDIFAVFVKAKNKAAVYLDSIVMKQAYASGVVFRARGFLARPGEIS